MAWYKTGTVSVTNGSLNVVGVDTQWLTQCASGDLFTLDGSQFYEVGSITDDTHLVLNKVYIGTTLSAQSYAIIRNFTSTTNAALALSLADMLAKWHFSLDELLLWLTSSSDVQLTNPATQVSVTVKTPAQISSAVTGKLLKTITVADVALTTSEAANGFIVASGALTADRSIIMPASQSQIIAVTNNCTGAYLLTVKTAAGAGIVVEQGKRALLFSDGTNVVNAFDIVDINGGAIDGTEIGWAIPAAVKGTTLIATASIVSSAGAEIIAGGGTCQIPASATRGIMHCAGSTDTFISWGTDAVNNGYIFGSSSLTQLLSTPSFALAAGGFSRLEVSASSGDVTPGADNAQAIGSGAKRWSAIFAATGTINTSDAREKTPVRPPTAAEITAAIQISKEIGFYKWLAAIAEKGEGARSHVGLTVQRAIEIIAANGLNPFDYGFICYNQWSDVFVEHPEILATEAIPSTDTKPEIPAVEYQAAWIEQTQVAGDRYSFRMDELNMFMARGFEARLAALEAL